MYEREWSLGKREVYKGIRCQIQNEGCMKTGIWLLDLKKLKQRNKYLLVFSLIAVWDICIHMHQVFSGEISQSRHF